MIPDAARPLAVLPLCFAVALAGGVAGGVHGAALAAGQAAGVEGDVDRGPDGGLDGTGGSGPDEAATTLSRIGFVDIPYLIDRAPQTLEAERRLESEFRPRQGELESQRAELAQLAARLGDSGLSLDDMERARLDRETRGLERRIERDEQDFREELSIQKNTEFKTVRVLVLEAIARFGKRGDYDLIVSDGVLYANERIDVTERILESLSREHARLQSAN